MKESDTVNIPTTPEILAAAHASGKTAPRPSLAFWIAAIESIADVLGLGDGSPGEDAEYPNAATRDALAKMRATVGKPGARDARVTFVDACLTTAPDSDLARLRWGAVFGLCEVTS